MNKNELLDNPERPDELDLCKKAIELYLRGYSEFSKANTAFTVDDIEAKVIADAEYLAQGKDGIRYGAPGWGDVKLRYADGNFSLDSNGMDDKKFKDWQEFIGKKFKENNLKFIYI